MQKSKSITIAVALAGVLTVGGIKTAGYINDINEELTKSKNEVTQLKKENDKVTKDAQKVMVEMHEEKLELEKTIEKLEKENKQLKKEYLTKPITRGVGTPVKITMTFYGDFAHENGGYAGIDANGNKLVAGTVASNYYPQGTQFEFRGQLFVVRDRGGSNFNTPSRLDVFVPRLKNESDSDYAKRIRHYGVKKVTMFKR